MINYSRVLIAALLVSTLTGCGRSTGNVTVENLGQTPADVEIRIGRDRYELHDLSANERQTIWFLVPRQDSSYAVSAIFASGAQVTERVGYLSIDMTPSDAIGINETGVGFAAGYYDPAEPPSPLTPTSLRESGGKP